MGMIPEVVSVIVADLINEDFLNEERFSKSFARGKHNVKKWGWPKIKHELLLRNISKYNIESAFNEIAADYTKTLAETAEKQLLKIKENNVHKKRKKLADYLMYRGWEINAVYDKVRELLP